MFINHGNQHIFYDSEKAWYEAIFLFIKENIKFQADHETLAIKITENGTGD